ncbi:Auxin-responsive protein [Melia azedarach]|uniref:Auxin-responsive protein n=1 Tax=Melia azedarach TaxID=155640 RepID=A0ACC1Z0M2_MELAZ|nr:Auxin-responsive protein [Melia azedarach]
MDIVKEKWKKSLISRTWERCMSLGSGRSSFSGMMTKSKSWHCSSKTTSPERSDKGNKKCRVAPEGCFSVYVGPQKQRFVIKTEFANHPLFKMLLEDAESEYGYEIQGPITLPCEVDLFYNVLAEIESNNGDDQIDPGCSFAKGYSPLILCSPVRRSNHRVHSYKGYGAYRLLSPSRMLKMNGFYV